MRLFVKNNNLFQFNQAIKSNQLDETIHEQLDLLITKIDSSKTFSEYKPLFDVLCDILGFPNDRVLTMYGWVINSSQGQIYAHEKARKRSVPKSAVLYHGSDVGGITALRPTFKRSDDKTLRGIKKKIRMIEVLYPSERVYVHVDKPGSRFGEGGSSKYTYIVKDTESVMNKLYYDTELMGGSAAYIETSSEIPVYEDDTDKKASDSN